MAGSKPTKEPKERKPVVLSDKEALYPPNARAVKIVVIAMVVLIIVAIITFVTGSF